MTRAYLLDTHIVLWSLLDDPQLPLDARSIITDTANRLLVSAVSIWEIQIKHAKSPEAMPITAAEFHETLLASGYEIVNIAAEDIRELENLGLSLFGIHRDPFDHLLIAQAARLKAPLITHDERIGQYPLPYILRV